MLPARQRPSHRPRFRAHPHVRALLPMQPSRQWPRDQFRLVVAAFALPDRMQRHQHHHVRTESPAFARFAISGCRWQPRGGTVNATPPQQRWMSGTSRHGDVGWKTAWRPRFRPCNGPFRSIESSSLGLRFEFPAAHFHAPPSQRKKKTAVPPNRTAATSTRRAIYSCPCSVFSWQVMQYRVHGTASSLFCCSSSWQELHSP